MNRQISFLVLALLLPFFSSCEKMDQPQDYKASLETIINHTFDLNVQLGDKQFPKIDLPSSEGATLKEYGYVIYSGEWDLNTDKTLESLGIGKVELTKLQLLDDLVIENKVQGSFDLSKLSGLKLLNSDGKVIARLVEGNSKDQIKLKIEVKDILALTKNGKLSVQLVVDDISVLNDISSLDLNVIAKVLVEGGNV